MGCESVPKQVEKPNFDEIINRYSRLIVSSEKTYLPRQLRAALPSKAAEEIESHGWIGSKQGAAGFRLTSIDGGRQNEYDCKALRPYGLLQCLITVTIPKRDNFKEQRIELIAANGTIMLAQFSNKGQLNTAWIPEQLKENIQMKTSLGWSQDKFNIIYDNITLDLSSNEEFERMKSELESTPVGMRRSSRYTETEHKVFNKLSTNADGSLKYTKKHSTTSSLVCGQSNQNDYAASRGKSSYSHFDKITEKYPGSKVKIIACNSTFLNNPQALLKSVDGTGYFEFITTDKVNVNSISYMNGSFYFSREDIAIPGVYLEEYITSFELY